MFAPKIIKICHLCFKSQSIMFGIFFPDVVYIWFTSQFWSDSDGRRIQPPT